MGENEYPGHALLTKQRITQTELRLTEILSSQEVKMPDLKVVQLREKYPDTDLDYQRLYKARHKLGVPDEKFDLPRPFINALLFCAFFELMIYLNFQGR